MRPEEQAWLKEHYAEGDINQTLDGFEAAFGWRPDKHTVYTNAWRMGLRKRRQDPGFRGRRAEVAVRWSREPEMSAWMLDHDTGGHEQTAAAFEERFGIRLTRNQINWFRARHGTQRRSSRRGGSERRPIGFERRTSGGVIVKVAEEPTVPMSKDNWAYKHVLVYERTYGPIPEGWVVMHVDGDADNNAPENLAAVPRRVMGALNSRRSRNGESYRTREELLAAAGLEMLGVAIRDAESTAPRRCSVCGRWFTETADQRKYSRRVKTCPSCLAVAHRSGRNKR